MQRSRCLVFVHWYNKRRSVLPTFGQESHDSKHADFEQCLSIRMLQARLVRLRVWKLWLYTSIAPPGRGVGWGRARFRAAPRAFGGGGSAVAAGGATALRGVVFLGFRSFYWDDVPGLLAIRSLDIVRRRIHPWKSRNTFCDDSRSLRILCRKLQSLGGPQPFERRRNQQHGRCQRPNVGIRLLGGWVERFAWQMLRVVPNTWRWDKSHFDHTGS